MQKVGGYGSYVALCEDSRAYEDICLWLAAESDAARIEEMERQARR